MTNAQMVKCFNEWMRQYIEDPKAFSVEFENVNQFLKDEADGREPTYGETCTALMAKLAEQVPAE